MASYPLIKHCDMESEMRNEAVEICTGAVEKYGSTDLERASQLIKESMDKNSARRGTWLWGSTTPRRSPRR